MLIVDVCAFYTPHGGGVKTYVEQKLKALPAMGHDVVIIVPGDDARVEQVSPQARIVHLRSPSFPLDRRYRYFDDEAQLHATLDLLQPDVVEASSPWSSSSMVARWRGDAVRALIMHADPLASYAYRWLHPMMSHATIDQVVRPWWDHIRQLNDGFDLVVCANESLTGRLVRGGINRAVTVPMGIEPGLFSPGQRDEALRAALLARCGLAEDAHLLLSVGRMAAEKRLPMIIDAVAAAGQTAPVGLVMIGDGPERTRVERHIRRNPHIRLLSPERDRSRMATLLASADALVHGCESETFGMVAAEARASGLPMIVPDSGGASAQLAPGAGTSYRAGDATALTAAIMRFAAADEGGAAGQWRAAAIAASQHPISMTDHFMALCHHYARLLAPAARAA